MAPAQVVISEVNFPDAAGSDQWIELRNLGEERVDLSQWSIYYTTDAPGVPNFCSQPGGGPAVARCYWFGFWQGTAIDGGSYLKVNWMAPVATLAENGEMNTGASTIHFLFGIRAESLSPEAGAIGLFSTQQSAAMSSPLFVEDWLSWGTTGLPRESIAVAAGKWQAGTMVAAPIDDDSIALDLTGTQGPGAQRAWFRDATPTPMRANHRGGAQARSYGWSCHVGGLLQDPVLVSRSTPVHGNRDYELEVQGTATGMLCLLIGDALPEPGLSLQSYGMAPCALWVMPDPRVGCYSVPMQPGVTSLNSLLGMNPGPTLVGGPVALQAFAFAGFSDFGFSNGLELSVAR